MNLIFKELFHLPTVHYKNNTKKREKAGSSRLVDLNKTWRINGYVCNKFVLKMSALN